MRYITNRRKKTKLDLFAGRRIAETVDLLRQSNDPLIQGAVKHIGDIDWDALNRHIDEFAPEEVLLIGRLSGLMRLSQDLNLLGKAPIVILKGGAIVSNPWDIPIYVAESLEETQSLLKQESLNDTVHPNPNN